jgi:hypothetical protein
MPVYWAIAARDNPQTNGNTVERHITTGAAIKRKSSGDFDHRPAFFSLQRSPTPTPHTCSVLALLLTVECFFPSVKS